MRVRLGTDLRTISGLLDIDTTKYSMIGYERQIKQFRLDKSDLNKLRIDNNYFDSLQLNFYSDKLLSIYFYASGNRNVEFLKYDMHGIIKERGLSRSVSFRKGQPTPIDTSLEYGKYRELHYRSTDRQMMYYYSEDILDNVAMLSVTNKKLLKKMFRRRGSKNVSQQ